MLRYCLARLRRREDAEDAAQTTFVHAVRGLSSGVVPVSEPAWLLGIARNVCLSRRERSASRHRLEEVRDPTELERAAGADVPRDELIGLDRALQRLPEQQRRAVLLRDWRGLSYDEVAEQLGVSRAAVETLIFRGRDALAELLRDEPAATRRRLASLGNVASLVAAVRNALTGGAALGKTAAAVVTAAAVAGSGVTVGSVLERRPDETGTSAGAATVQLRARAAPTPARATPSRVAAAPAAPRADVPATAAASAAPVAPPAPGPATEQPAAPSADAPTTIATPEPPPVGKTPVLNAPVPKTPVSGTPVPAAPVVATPELGTPPPGTPALVDPVPAPVVELVETAVPVPPALEETVDTVVATVDETAATAPATVEATVEETLEAATAVVPAVDAVLPPLVTFP